MIGPLRRAAAIAKMAVALALIAGCSETPAPGADGTGATAQAAEGVVFRRGLPGEPDSLDPHRSEEAATHDLLRDLFEGLTAAAQGGEPRPAAASGWTLEEDGRLYRFTLRPGGRWSNGDPVVAEDFAASLRRAVDPATGSAYSVVLSAIENAPEIIAGERPPADLGVEATAELELVIRLAQPTPYLLGLLANPVAFPVHRPSLAEHGPGFARAGKLVSNGPYRLTDWVVNDRLRLERNPYYDDGWPVAVDTVYYLPLEEPAAELQRYRAGELDFTESIPNGRFDWIREQFGDQLVVAPYLAVYYYMFNTTRAPFDDAGLRSALSMVVNRELLTERVTGVGELPAYTFVPPGVNGHNVQLPDWFEAVPAERLAEARRLYAAAGFSEESPLRVQLVYNTGDNHKRVALAVASMWKEALGVEVEPVNMELKVMLERRRDRSAWTVMRLGWVGDYDDAYNFLEIMRSDHGQNDTGFSDAEYDRLLDLAALETDPARRSELLEAAERLMLAQAPVLPLYFNVTKHLVQPWVEGFEPNILDHNYTRYLAIDTRARGY